MLVPHTNQPGRWPLLTGELVLACAFSSSSSNFHDLSSFSQYSCSFLQVAWSDGVCNGELGNLVLVAQGVGRNATKR